MGGQRRLRSYIGLGGNLGDAGRILAEGVGALASLPGARLRGVSSLYATAPWGVTDQPEFRNAVAALDVRAGSDPTAAAIDLLTALKEIELDLGRRPAGRWGPRAIDLDILLLGRARISVERPPSGASVDAHLDAAKAARWLVIPHPEMSERLFVLAPLAELAPRLVPPGWSTTVEKARRRRGDIEGPDSVRPLARWNHPAGGWIALGGQPSVASGR
jgi:2-amino-4-hydroxy-6-hydroxymethyldihydropteridine diphosphokinase